MKNPTPSLPAFGNYNGTLDVSAAISAAFKGNKAIAVPLRHCRSRHNPPHSAAFRRIPPRPRIPLRTSQFTMRPSPPRTLSVTAYSLSFPTHSAANRHRPRRALRHSGQIFHVSARIISPENMHSIPAVPFFTTQTRKS